MVDAAPLTLWVLVTSSDVTTGEGEEVASGSRNNKRLVSVKMWPHWSAREVQAALLQAAETVHARMSSSNSVRLRDSQGALLALTPITLKSSPTHPLFLEISSPGETGRGGEHPLLPRSFRETVEAITSRMEARVAAVELGLAGLDDRRAALLEEELQRIQDTLNFMTRRLDLTCAPAWVTGVQT